MITYADKERAKYWPVSPNLMEQYNDGLHTFIGRDGGLLWYQNGKCHRDGDLPAVIYTDGSLLWCQNGLTHRDGDKPACIGADGRLDWYQNGLWHRDGDLPAIIGRDGILQWWQNGQRHRFSGPAIIYPDGKQEWWINSKNITQEVRKWLNKKHWRNTPEQIFEFQLRFL